MKILEKIRSERLYFDGSAGTYLQSLGYDDVPYTLNLTKPQAVIAMHKSYLEAGCDIICTNTFGANRLKALNYAEIIESAIANSKEAVRQVSCGEKFIALENFIIE